MKDWGERSKEIAFLLNPAFCGRILWECIDSYKREFAKDMPFPLLFLILPILLHKKTRNAMPKSVRKMMHVWLEENPIVRVGFSERAQALVQITREALIFYIEHNQIAIDTSNGYDVSIIQSNLIKRNGYVSSELKEILKKARVVGRWFGQTGDTSTILSIWGVKL